MNPPSDEAAAKEWADRDSGGEYCDGWGDHTNCRRAFRAGAAHACAELAQEIGDLKEALERIRDGKDKCHGMIIADMGFTHFAQLTAREVLAKYGEK